MPVYTAVVTITQANITDLRLNTSLCGIVSGTVSQADTTTIFIQYQSWFDSFTVSETAAFTEWFDSVKDILDENTAIQLMAMIDNKQDKLTAGVDYATPAALNTKQNKISTSGLLKCDGNGNITPAVPGVDYMTPSSATPSSAAKVCYDRKDYYVNAVSGNDNNDGLSTATAWKTVTKVNSVINEYDIYQKQVFFNFAAGNYPEVLEIRSKVGEIRIQCTSGTNTVFGNISVSYSGMVCFYYITADMISVTHSQYADIFYCTVEKSLTVVASKARVEGVTVRNTSNGIHAMNSSVVYASNNKGTGNGSGLTAYASIILKTGTQPSGTVAETKTYGGQIFS